MHILKFLFKVPKKLGLLNWLSDECYVKLQYALNMGRFPDLQNPCRFIEKLNWLKIHDHDPRYSALVDKWDVMDYVSERIGEGYCIKKFGVWDSFDEIDFDALPDQFVLKCTHDSGGIVICKDKASFNKAAARRKLNRSMKRSYYWHAREWPYRNIRPRILAEEFMTDLSGTGLLDYKFFCFDGEPEFMYIATGRADGNTHFDFYDRDFNWLPVRQHCPNAAVHPEKPEGYEEMLELARKLSRGLKHVRVDFFQSGGKVYFGELTMYHLCGYERFDPDEFDFKFGEYLKLDL